MQKIITNLWFDSQAEEAVNFYTSLFENSKIGSVSRYSDVGKEVHGQPAGQVMTMEFQILGQNFLALNGGPTFKFTPSISFLVFCKSKEEVDRLWKEISRGGKILMELDAYPFSDWYGWTEDRFGLSWQIMLARDDFNQAIVPTLMFTQDRAGKAEEAINFYTGVFKDSQVGDIMRYEAGEEPDQAGTIKHAGFKLAGQEFAAMDSAHKHEFTFNEAISFIVNCENQAEIDYFWEKLSAVPESEQCGWLKDKYGVSWQIVPKNLGDFMSSGDQQKTDRVMSAFLDMKKLDLAELEKAFAGL